MTGIEALIKPIRGHRVMLDGDLARLYGVLTGALKPCLVLTARTRLHPDSIPVLAAAVDRALAGAGAQDGGG